MDKNLTFSISRRSLKIALILAVVMTVLAPVAVIAAAGTFTDDDDSVSEADIEWMAANGITSGCGTDIYCPDDGVTRGEMAAFMKRLATKKVVDAATAVTAQDAGTVGGQLPSEFAATAHTHTAAAITNETGAASGSNDAGSLTTTLAAMTSATITVPSDGYLLAHADAQINVLHTNGSVSTAEFGLSLSSTVFDHNSQDNAIGVPSTAPTGNYFFGPGVTGLFPVTAGEHTVYFLGREISGGESFNDPTITVLFVPTAYGAVATNGAPAETDAAN